MKKITHLIDLLSDCVGTIIAPLTLIMMLLTCIVVAARYLFNVGATSIQETVIYLHGIVFMLGIAYTLRQSGHVSVDIVYQRLSLKTRAVVNLFGTLVFLFPVAIFLIWTSLDYVSFSWSLKEGSPEPGGLPFVYLLKTLIPVMAILLLLQGIAELLRNLETLLQGKH
ncbi:MAG: TRAP transporter small permease subunit [bacterium]